LKFEDSAESGIQPEDFRAEFSAGAEFSAANPQSLKGVTQPEDFRAEFSAGAGVSAGNPQSLKRGSTRNLSRAQLPRPNWSEFSNLKSQI